MFWAHALVVTGGVGRDGKSMRALGEACGRVRDWGGGLGEPTTSPFGWGSPRRSYTHAAVPARQRRRKSHAGEPQGERILIGASPGKDALVRQADWLPT